MIETVQKWLELRKELQELGVIGVSIWDDNIHLYKENFSEQFKGMKMKIEDDWTDNFPYRISVEVDGIEFFTICNLQELEEYFPELAKENDYVHANG